MADQPTGKDEAQQSGEAAANEQAGQSPQPESSTGDASVDEALAAADKSLDEIKAAVDVSADEEAGEGEQGVGEEGPATSLDLLGDVELDVMIELGRTEMLVEDVLKLQSGSVVELDKLAGDPVDVYVNGRLVARGEVLVLNDNFCIRINEVLADLEEEAEAAAAAEAQQAKG